MNFEIKINSLEQYFLKHMLGFSEQLPALVGTRYLKEHKSSFDFTDNDELPIIFRERLRGREKLEEALSINYAKQKEIWGLYEKSFVVEKKSGHNRYQVMLKVLEGMKQEDRRTLERLDSEYKAASHQIESLHNANIDIYARSVFRLHGIVGIVQGYGRSHKYFYRCHVIPNENFVAANQAVTGGKFKKLIERADVRLLDFLLERTKDIKKKSWKGHAPRFSVPQIMNEVGVEDRSLVESSLHRLTGLLCHTYGPCYRVYNMGGTRTAIYANSWFIPFRLHDKIQEIIQQ